MSNVAKLKKRALEFEQKKQFDKALETYAQILEGLDEHVDEGDVALYNRVGDLLLRRGDVAAAVDHYERAVDLYTDGGFFNNAIALCNKILRNAPGRNSVYYKLGKISAKKGFVNDAKQNFLEYADRMQRGGQLEEAFRALKEFADLCPDQDDIRLMLADQLVRKDRKQEAIEQLQLLYDKFQSEGRTREARATVDRMKALDPELEPTTGSVRTTTKPNDLVFLDVNFDEAPPVTAPPRVVKPVSPPAPAKGPVAPLPRAIADLPLIDVGMPPEMVVDEVPPVEGLTPTDAFESAATDAASPELATHVDAGLINGFEQSAFDADDTDTIAASGGPIDGLEPTTEPAAHAEVEEAGIQEDVLGLDIVLDEPASPLAGLPMLESPEDLLEGSDEIELTDDSASEEREDDEDAPLTFIYPGDDPRSPDAADEDTGPELELILPDDYTPDPERARPADPGSAAGLMDAATFASDESLEEADASALVEDVDQAFSFINSGGDLPSIAEPETVREPHAAPEPEPQTEVQRLRATVARAPRDYHLLRQLAEALLEEGNRAAGLSELERAMLGFEGAGDLRGASAVAEELIRVEPGSAQFHQKRVEYAVRANDKSRLVDAYLALAECLFGLGQLDKSRAVYARVLELAPNEARARAALRTLGGDDTLAAAPTPPRAAPVPRAPARDVPARAPSPAADDDDFVNLADWLREDDASKSTRMVLDVEQPQDPQQVDFAEMLSKFKEGVAANVDETDHESHYDLGVAYKEMGLLDEAISEFQKALRGSENRVRTYEALGQCFVEKRQYQIALTILSRALGDKSCPDDVLVGVLYLLGYASESLGRWQDAQRFYERVCAVDIQFRDVGDRLAAVERKAR